MMMLSEIAKAVNGQMLGADTEVFSVGSDSRNIIKNQLFVAIKGEKFDGNTYRLKPLNKGRRQFWFQIPKQRQDQRYWLKSRA